jgi:serine/threonine protein kinase/dienelactone hydrolase
MPHLDKALWLTLSPLLDRALDLDPPAREALLASTSEHAPAVAAELRRMLAEHDRVLSSRFLEEPPDVGADLFPTLAGQEVGAYRLERALGVGGMGTVWLARRSDGRFEGSVAIKFLHLAVLDRRGQERFRREGTLLARLSHPHIARLLDAGVTSAGQPYLVLEYVDGVRIDQYAAARELDLDARLRLFLEVADAVAHAHANLVVHRDLKPSNILVDRDGGAKLLDFGVATLLAADADAAPTRTGVALTPEYAAPEQISGEPVTTATDVYALGVLLFKLIVGRHPTAEPGMTEAAVLLALAERAAPRPSDVVAQLADSAESARLFAERRTTPERLQRRCRGDLDVIVGTALKKDVGRRYQSVSAFADDVRRYVCGDAVKARGDSRRYRARKFVAQHPLQLGAAAAVATTLVVAAVAGWIVYRDKRIQQLRQETLPRIAAMQKKTDFAAAYRLLRTVEPELVGDPEFEKTRAEVLVEASVRTSPPGADVYVKGYGEIAEEWLYLGRTPLVDMRAPFGYYRWRVQKDGYATVEGAGTLGLNNITIALQPERTLPAGMVYVPGSTVRVEQTRVELPPFYFDRYEVTNREYKRFIDAGGYRTRDYWTGPFLRDGRELSWEDALRDMRDATGHPGPSTWRLGTYPQGQDDLPVQGVSWYEAAAFARYAGKRLPTVHHWRRAAAADSLYSDVIEHSNFGTKGPAAVGAYAGIGGYGTFDLAGNVKEWTSNAVGDKRYILGGAWNEPSYQYSATDALEPFDRAAGNGFRGMTPLAGTTLDAALDRPLPSVVRDYTDERPVADSVFRIYRSLYAYDRSDLEAVVESSDDSPEHWRVERVSYAAAYRGERIPALLFLPKSAAPPYQTIVYFPAGQNIQQFHKWEINYLDFVLRSGRAVLLPMYMGIYERRLDPSIQGLHAVRDVTIQRMKDLQRSVDYIYARPDLDESRLAFFGVSLGAALAPIALAIEPRFKAAVLWSGGFSSVARLPEADQINFAPRVRTPVLMMNGRDDFTYPVKASQEPMFRWLGTPHQDKRHLRHAGGHICPFEGNIKDTLDWLDRYLGAIA